MRQAARRSDLAASDAVFSQIRAAYREQRASPSPEHLLPLLIRLPNALLGDFLVQEAAMERAGYPGLERHKAAHDRILSASRGMVLVAERDGMSALRARLPLLIQLILMHQVREDRVADGFLRLRER